MLNTTLKDYVVGRILPRVHTPAQYLGGELNAVHKDHRDVRGTLCLSFPDLYSIGMSCHGLQVLYTLMNDRPDWACERVFAPLQDMEQQLREHDQPYFSLESFTPLYKFDVLGFTLQYEIGYSNILTILDLGRIPLRSVERTAEHPLVIAGGPCAQNPEPIAPFIDVLVTGDGEPSLPLICDYWLKLKEERLAAGPLATGEAGQRQREEMLAELAQKLPFAYCPRFYEPEYTDGRFITLNRLRTDVPETIEPSVISDLDAIPLPTRPIVPYVESVHDRISIEIMRGCPWQCRFCQSTVIKRPMRIREIETIVASALEAHRNTGFEEISLLSLSSSDYPNFEKLVTRMQETFRPLGVNISLPSLRVNEQLFSVTRLFADERKRGFTLAPEVARDDMREQIRKKIKNEDLYEGCRQAFQNGWKKVKLYFLCGLPGERKIDLDGIIEMAEHISEIGKQVLGRYAEVTASVSNFVPKPHTPYQWNRMEKREYFQEAHRYLRHKCRLKSVKIKCHMIETSLLEGVLTLGDRRVADVIEHAWRNGARLDSWGEHMQSHLWWDAIAACGIDVDDLIHRAKTIGERLPWDHVNVKKGRTFLEKEQNRALAQLSAMADAT
ncbi:MAG TPA: TIGR03960 family B12-binding radical SAM protein [Pirellulales bacterium]